MFSCPYTGSSNLVEALNITRNRPETYKIVQCPDTGFYSAKHQSGKIYPLEDRLDPDSDIVLKIIDDE